MLRFLLNVIWLVFGGFWLAVGYAVAGLVCCVLIVTIPFGIAAFRNANFCLWPFGRTLVKRGGAGIGSALGNVLWLVLAGWWLALLHVVTGVVQCVTIVGIPLGLANIKMFRVALWPLGREVAWIDDRLGFTR
ncbi:YccF domain-containing protein [Allokutzneria oryzae]|uniref:YccF domain-containing protein n=1 Tax=Allokutzneria oryzae TaxID=1378989 RepID=A0ABV6A6T8_9PSEU